MWQAEGISAENQSTTGGQGRKHQRIRLTKVHRKEEEEGISFDIDLIPHLIVTLDGERCEFYMCSIFRWYVCCDSVSGVMTSTT